MTDKKHMSISRLNRRHFGGLMMGGSMALAGCSSDVLDGKRVLYATDSQANDYPAVQATLAMGKYLDEKSKGRISIKHYPGGQLGSEGSTLEIAMFGGLDLTRTFAGALNNIAPLTKLFSLPFLFRSTEHQRSVIDIAGQKIRVPNSDIFLATMRALGANPTPMNFSEVYQGLVQNVIDGAENNWPAYISTRHYEVAPNYSETGHFRTPDMLIMSLREPSHLGRFFRRRSSPHPRSRASLNGCHAQPMGCQRERI